MAGTCKKTKVQISPCTAQSDQHFCLFVMMLNKVPVIFFQVCKQSDKVSCSRAQCSATVIVTLTIPFIQSDKYRATVRPPHSLGLSAFFRSLENTIRCSTPETGFYGAPFEIVHDKIHARIQEFSSGGGGGGRSI